MAWLIADLGGLRELDSLFLRRRENGSRQRMFRVSLQTRYQGQYLVLLKARSDELFCQLRLAISERPGLVENRSPALGNLLKHDGALDDDRPTCTEGNGTDDGNRYREEQRARRGDDQHRQESNGFSTHAPTRGWRP